MSLEIAELYGHVTLQGAPSFGLRCFGVPPGGPFDRESHATANALLGNKQDANCVELAMAVGRLIAVTVTEVGFAGAVCEISVDGSKIPMSGVVALQPGQELRFAPPAQGARLYLSLPGGVECDNLKRGGTLNALEDRAGPTSKSSPDLQPSPRPISYGSSIRAIRFGDSGLLAELVGCNSLKIRLDSDRVGLRLEGICLEPGPEKLSEPACPGAIQVTNDGSVIVLGPDGPTIGGYRKIGVVCSVDLNALGQLRPGVEVRFEEVSKKSAIELWTNRMD